MTEAVRGGLDDGTERNNRLAGPLSTAPNPPATELYGSRCPPMPDGRMPVVPGYTLLRLLGAGSFGQVYQACEEATGKTVAIKFFTSGAGDRWQALLEEVRQHARLDGVGGIVDLKHVVSAADPPYYVMAFADGGSLEDRLQAGLMSPTEATPLFRRVTRALAYVHAKGICHCDIKPANILLDARGQPLLADFGQAAPSSSHGAALGTLFYMPPDQADTRTTLPDPGWDVYALGAVMYTLLTGLRPRFSADVQAELHLIGNLTARLARYRQWLHDAPAPVAHRRVRGVDADLARIIDRCLDLDPKRRFSDGRAVLQALGRRQQRQRRRPMLRFGLAVSMVVLVLGAVTAARSKKEAVDALEHDLTRQMLESNQSSASLIARAVEHALDVRRTRVQSAVTAELCAATRRADRPALEKDLWRLMTSGDKANRLFGEATVTNARGELLAMVRREPAPAGRGPTGPSLHAVNPAELPSRYTQFSWRDWFSGQGDRFELADQRHPPIRKTHVSDPYVSSLNPSDLFVSLSEPIRTPGDATGEPMGVIEAAILLPEMSRWLHEASIAQGGFAAVFDRRSHCIVHPDPRFLPRRGEPARRFFTREQRRSLFPDTLGVLPDYHDPIDGHRYLAGYARMTDADFGWLVLVQHERKEILRPLKDLRTRLAWIGWQSFASSAVLVACLWGGLFWMLRRLDPMDE